MGPGGEEVAGRLAEAGLSVVGVERELVGGECPYWGCVPSKMMIRGVDADRRGPAGRWLRRPAPGRAGPRAGRASGSAHEATDDWDDTGRRRPVRGQGRPAGPRLGAARRSRPGASSATTSSSRPARGRGRHGSAPVVPPIEGLADTRYWTNREAISATTAPASLAVLGGGAIGRRARADVRALRLGGDGHRGDGRLLPPEEPEAGEVVAAALRADGRRASAPARRRSGSTAATAT